MVRYELLDLLFSGTRRPPPMVVHHHGCALSGSGGFVKHRRPAGAALRTFGDGSRSTSKALAAILHRPWNRDRERSGVYGHGGFVGVVSDCHCQCSPPSLRSTLWPTMKSAASSTTWVRGRKRQLASNLVVTWHFRVAEEQCYCFDPFPASGQGIYVRDGFKVLRKYR